MPRSLKGLVQVVPLSGTLPQLIEIGNLRASAIFEDREIRDRSNSLRLLDAALINAVGTAQLLQRMLDVLGHTGASTAVGIDKVIDEATAAIQSWGAGTIDAAGTQPRSRSSTRAPSICPASMPRSALAG